MANYKSPSLEAEKADGKRKISPQSIYNSLVSAAKAGIHGGVIATVIIAVVFIPLGILLSNVGNLEPGWGTVVIFGFTSVPVLIFLVTYIGYHRHMKQITSGAYSLIKDTVERVVTDDKTVRKHNGHSYVITTEHAMYLYRCGRVVISLEETYTNSEGDICYVVVFDKNPNTPIFIYNSKFYELEDLEETE